MARMVGLKAAKESGRWRNERLRGYGLFPVRLGLYDLLAEIRLGNFLGKIEKQRATYTRAGVWRRATIQRWGQSLDGGLETGDYWRLGGSREEGANVVNRTQCR